MLVQHLKNIGGYMKSKTTIFALLVVSLFFCNSILLATDYFVSPTGSNTTGNGTIGNPWQTIEYAINNIYPGDILYLRGGVYNEQVTSVRSGTADAYITISSYNNEDAIIDGSGGVFNNGVIIDHSYLKLIGFTSRTWGSTGIWLRDCQFVELLKLKVTDVMGGIDLTGTIHDFVIDSCIIYDYYGGSGGHGIDATPGGTDSIYNGVIKNTKAYTAGAFDNCDGFGLGHDGISNIYLYNCEAYRVGDGFDISGRDIILERCSAHDCSYGGGYKLWRDSVTVINCIGYNNPTNLELDFDNATNKGVKARLINCTFWESGGANIVIERSTLGSKLEMFNCILSGSNNTGLTFGDSDSASCYTGDYNIFHGYNPVRVISTSGPDFSLTQIQNGEWTAFSGQDAHSQVVFDASALFMDTLGTNPNLGLMAGALAIDNGTNLPDAPLFDFNGCSRNVGQIDIGAYEYGACGVGILDEGFENSYSYYIDQNYPNPFNPITKIRYSIPSVTLSKVQGSLVTLKVYDVLGNEIATLVNEQKPSGRYEVEFNAQGLTSGVYFYKIRAGSFSETKKMVLLK
jgi:Secretion system C-terminal sorting domain